MDVHTSVKTASNSRFLMKIIVLSSLALMASSQSVSEDQEDDKTPIETALEPIFSLTRGFIKFIQPNDLKEAEVIYDKWKDKMDKDNMKFEEIAQEEEFWVDTSEYFMGFIVCVGIGVILLVIMFWTGLIMCCCRCCCGNCGASVDPREGRNSKSKRVCCGLLLFIFNTILLAGCLILFMSNELLQEQTSREPGALLPQVGSSISSVENYKDVLIVDLRHSLVDDLEKQLDQTIATLENAPTTAKDELNKNLQTSDILQQAVGLVDSVEVMNTNLVQVQDLTNQLQGMVNTLSSNVFNQRNAIISTIDGSCPDFLSTSCNDVRTSVNSISVLPDYSQVYDISGQLTVVQSLLNSDPSLRDLVNRGVNEYNKVSEEVTQRTYAEVNDIKAEKTKVTDSVNDQVDNFERDLHEQISLNTTKLKIQEQEENVEEYGTYRWYAGIAIGCMFLLIIIFYYIGIMFGCGEPPYEEGSSTCNRGVGANLFMAAVVFTFLFFWLLMIILIIHFVVGGPMYSELCRNLIEIEDSPSVETLDKLLDNFLEEADIGYEIDIASVLNKCKSNGALYQAFNLDQVVNLTDVLDLKKYNLESEIDKIRDININFGDIEMLDMTTEMELTRLATSQLDGIDFDSYYVQLQKQPTTPDLVDIANEIDTLANQDTTRSQFSRDMRVHSQNLRDLDSQEVITIEQTSSQLKSSLQTLQGEIEGTASFSVRVSRLITALNAAEVQLTNDGNQIVKDFLSGLAGALYKDIEYFVGNLTHNLQYEIGKCAPLYNALDTAIVAGCQSFLDPLNTFWFAMGWCLIMTLPCMVFALCLVNEYRKTDEYESADNKSFDDPNFDAYAGAYPGDNIPLEDNRNRVY